MWSLPVPRQSLSEHDVEAGLRSKIRDGLYSQTMGVLSTGVFQVGFAGALGVSNAVIGILAAIPFLLNLASRPCRSWSCCGCERREQFSGALRGAQK